MNNCFSWIVKIWKLKLTHVFKGLYLYIPGYLLQGLDIRQKQPLEVFCKNIVLKNFKKFTGKHPCQSLFNKVVYLRPATILKVVLSTFFLVCTVTLKMSTLKSEKNAFYFTPKSSLLTRENQEFQILKFHDVIKCLSIKQEIHLTE